MSYTFTRAELDAAVDNVRRLERVHQALSLWSMVEDSEAGPLDDEQRAMDVAYRNAAAWLLADVSRHRWAGDNSEWDLVTDSAMSTLDSYPGLIEAAQQHTVITRDDRTGEVDRAVAAARAARDRKAAHA